MATDFDIHAMNDLAARSAGWRKLETAPHLKDAGDLLTSDLLRLARQLDNANSVISSQEARIAQLEASVRHRRIDRAA